MNDYRPYFVYWSLKLDPEEPGARKEVAAAKAAIKRWCQPAFYARRMIGFIVVTDETALELALRLRSETAGLFYLENAHVLAAPKPDDIACALAGTIGPLNHWARQGWIEAGERNQPEHHRNRKRR